MEALNIDSVICSGKYKGHQISELITDKKAIFELLKEGHVLSDEVLSEAKIKRVVRNVKTISEVVYHSKDDRIMDKDTESLSKIIKDLETITKKPQNFEDSNE